jgi:anti-anti-sigma factor
VLHIDQTTYTTQHGTTIIVLTPTGRLDITTAWQFRVKLQESLYTLSRHVVVNLGRVDFIDSSGLTSLVAGMRDADKVNGSFRLCNLLPAAKVVLEITMMDSVLEIYENCNDCFNHPETRRTILSPRKGGDPFFPDTEASL